MRGEYVLCAAYWLKDFTANSKDEAYLRRRGTMPYNTDCGIVIPSWRHFNCIALTNILTGSASIDKWDYEDGFITSAYRFVDREEAGRIAFKAGQTEKHIKSLFSEDIY